MTVEDIKAAITQLPDPDRRQLCDWLEEQSWEAWDAEIERDFSPGRRGEQLLGKIKQQILEDKFALMDWNSSGPETH